MTNTKRLVRISASLIAALMLVAAVLCVAPLEVKAEDPVNYIYFDLAAGDVQITKSTYSGYVFEYGTGTVIHVTGERNGQNDFYVYQSTTANRSTTGRKDDGTIVLPEYDRVTYYDPVTCRDQSWGEYITNHPGDTNASTNDNDDYDGSASVKKVITAWEDAVSGKRTSTEHKITFSGNVGEVELVIDNIWSHYQTRSNSRMVGAIEYYTNKSGIDGNKVTIKLKGDNRLPNIYYNTYGSNDTGDFVPVDNSMVFDAAESDATLTVADNKDAYGGNYWSSAIGSSDHNGDKCYGLVFNGGIIYAGTTDADDCTAIGAGGNGAATITINGGTITAVASTSGATIGGGIGKNSPGGSADIKITGGTVYSYNFGYGYGSTTISGRQNDSYIVSSAIGGGSSYAKAGCEYAFVEISGGTVYAQSVGGTAIGGGSSIMNNGGSTAVTISGGTVTAKSVSGRLFDNSKASDNNGVYVDIPAGVAIGGGTGNMTGGMATLNVSGNAVLYTGSIGGGGFTNTGGNGKIGPAFVTISGGTIQGQIVMQGSAMIEGVEQYSTFKMTGGVIDNQKASGYVFKETDGGAVCVRSGTAMITGGTIQNCNAQHGGAVYVSGGNVTMSGGTISRCEATENGGAVCVNGGTFTISGTGKIETLSAKNGGAVYVSGGDAIMSGGTITSYAAAQGQTTIPALATNGGAVCVEGGSFTISAGTIEKTAAEKGGAVYVSGGDAKVNGGALKECSAITGGAIYVQGGTVTMLGGEITNNKATEGNGGAIYVTGNSDLSVIVQSGTISGNSAAGKGGAISVEGAGNIEVTVQIGVNDLHYNSDGTEAIPPCDHNKNTKNDEENLEGNGYCPIVRDNTCASEGGAIYITGSTSTNLNIYCIEESDNRGAGNPANSDKTSLSDFLKVDGGNVLISATDAGGDVYFGNSVINSSIHVTGGNLTVQGTMINPAVFAPITVDVVASGGSYNDFRKNDDNTDDKYYVIRYFENFKQTDANGQETTTGQYTVHQALRSQPHTVWGVIYSHTGQTIVGWNTKQDGKGKDFAVSSVIQYAAENPNDTPLIFTDADLINGITLELYAIWAENFYYIQFEPNASSYTGTMGENGDKRQTLLCAAESTNLIPNKYVNRGYKFVGWAETPNATTAKYDDQEAISPALTQEVGKVFVFYAVWELCDHTEKTKFVFAQGTGDDSVTCTCQCAYVVTATIVPPAGKITYDNNPHPARIVYTNDNGDNFTETMIDEFKNLSISYSYEPNMDGHRESGNVTEAGTYTATATISETDIKVSVTFTIARATQPAPDKPTFTASGNTLTIDTPAKVTGDAGLAVLYKLVHTVEGVLFEKGPQESREFQEFDALWTLYYVAAYYPGNNNYLQSETITSDQKYLFEGGVSITVVDEYGIKTELVKPSEGEPSFVSNHLVGYYISSGYKATITVTDKDGNALSEDDQNTIFNAHFIPVINPVDKIFSYLINPFENNSSYNITITFEGAKLEPTVDASVAPNEQFGVVTDVATTISNDSAFTAYFEVEHFDTEVYSDLALWFTQALPAGTTVIMVDKSSGSYWHATVGEGGEDTIAISSFKQMGVGSGSPTIGATLKYQFIVDFSDIDQNALINAASLGVELTATVGGSEVGYAPDLPTTGKTITLDNVTHSLGEPSIDGNSATMDMGYAQGAANASKWTDREVVLVLTPSAPSQLPIDASIMVIETVGSQTKTTTVTINDRDEFVIPLDRNATNLKVVLQSEMFTEATYAFTATLYAAYEADAPMNGEKLATLQSIELTTTPKAQNAAKITVEGNTRIFDLKTGTIKFDIKTQLSEGYTATVTLLHKQGEKGYVSTGWSEKLQNGSNSFAITNLKEAFGTGGSFCLLVVIRDSSSTAVLEVPYYLIIQE